MKKRVLLIGGAGTLASDILFANLKNYEFYVVDNFVDSTLKEHEISALCRYKNANVADQYNIYEVFENFKPEVVVYLATSLSNNQQLALESNVSGMKNAISAAEKFGLPKLIYLQSFLTRNCDNEINASTPVEAKDSYATWKLAAEYLLEGYRGIKTTLILASVLSPRLSIGAVPAFTKRILRNETIKVTNTFRDYLSPKTFIYGLTHLLDLEQVSEKYVLGSGTPISTLEIMNIVAEQLDKNISSLNIEMIEKKGSDPERIILDSTWFKSLPQIEDGIRQGVKEIVTQIQHFDSKVRLHH